MTIEYDQPPTVEDLLEAQELLELAKAGLQPPVSAWIKAPMITEYREVPARSYADEGMIEIEGLIFGHPSLPGGTPFRTNALVLGDIGSRFVCTLRGYYRLGAPAKGDQH